MKFVWALLAFTLAWLLFLLSLSVGACGDDGSASRSGTPPAADGNPSTASATEHPGEDDAPIGDLLVRVPEPVAMDFTPDGRIFFNARQRGEIRWIDKSPAVTGGPR